MEENKLHRPIFVIGSVRSGTTILGDIISQHEDVAYWLEPKYIWKYKKARANDDFRYKEEAQKSVKKYIRNRFLKFTQARNKKRFLEKTPSNVFRIPFMYEVFPNGLFVQIVRNGYDSILSAEKKWTTRPDSSAIKRRLVSNEIPLTDLPFYFFDAVRDVFARFMFPNKGFIWGQHFKGIHEYRKEHTIFETCARQWLEGVSVATEELSKVPKNQVYTLKYEELLDSPEEVLTPLFNFLGLSSEKVIEYAKKELFATKTKVYTDQQQKDLKAIDNIISAEMEKWGYLNKV